MDRVQLKQRLGAAGVPEDSYLLVGLEAPRSVSAGACIVRPNERSWEVLVWEPRREQRSLSFSTEDEACEYVLAALTVTPAGPATAPAAGAVGALSADEAAAAAL